MSQFGVGEFARGKTVVHRMPTNPMDRSTIVSLLPKMITEYKPTLFPGRFTIPAAKPGDYELFIVEPSSWFIPNITERQPPTEVPVNSTELAKSIVLDYCNGIFQCDMDTKMPGLFYIPGEFTRKTIINYVEVDREGIPTGKTFVTMLESAKKKQNNWFLALIDSADQLWARSGGNPLAISDDARIAADVLQLNEKPWMKNNVAAGLINCKFCGEMINPLYPVCKHCHAILDPKKAKELDIQFAVAK